MIRDIILSNIDNKVFFEKCHFMPNIEKAIDVISSYTEKHKDFKNEVYMAVSNTQQLIECFSEAKACRKFEKKYNVISGHKRMKSLGFVSSPDFYINNTWVEHQCISVLPSLLNQINKDNVYVKLYNAIKQGIRSKCQRYREVFIQNPFQKDSLTLSIDISIYLKYLSKKEITHFLKYIFDHKYKHFKYIDNVKELPELFVKSAFTYGYLFIFGNKSIFIENKTFNTKRKYIFKELKNEYI